ncbi:hypothetical protein Gohar_021229 [Gossypium harknessii]|uniref:Uncharacterized protein n=1 Tax=Gossypium harknessii TaxID=34285 RepID=A0A7J9IER2_9ROSI|nr:hypothetical protein [Gossypium harknessii]
MSLTPLISILTENKLNGNKFREWKRNLLIVFSCEKHKFILDETCLTEDQPKARNRWKDPDSIGQVALARQTAIKILMNSQQKIDTPIKEHMLKLMGFFTEVDYNGVELDVNTVTYNLGNKTLTLTQLMKELQSYELMLNGGKPGKQKAKGKKKPTKSSVPPRMDRKKAKKSKDPKKTKCFFCNRK